MTRVKEGDICEGKVADLKETKKMHRIRVCRLGAADGPKEYSMKMLIRMVWGSADEELSMNQERKRKFEFCEDFDDLVVIFSIVYF